MVAVHTELKYCEEEMMEEKGGKESNFLLPLFFLSVKNDDYESDKPVTQHSKMGRLSVSSAPHPFSSPDPLSPVPLPSPWQAFVAF